MVCGKHVHWPVSDGRPTWALWIVVTTWGLGLLEAHATSHQGSLGPLKANSPPRSGITQNVGPSHLPSSALLSLQLSLCCYALIQAAHPLLPPRSLELYSIENKSSNIFTSRGESSFHLPACLKPHSYPRTQLPSPSGCRAGRRDSLFPPPTMAFPNYSSSTHI